MKNKILFNKNELTYWKSLEDKENNPSVIEAKHNEFKTEIAQDDNMQGSGLSRRKFLAISAASTALVATACTNYHDKGEIVSYNKKPQDALPGLANYYASTCTGCSLSCGILIKTRSGRPVKVDGNNAHPINMGKICSIGQASLMNLYSPERIKAPIKKKGGDLILFKNDLIDAKWAEIDKEIIEKLNKAQAEGKQIAIVSRKIDSPSEKKVIDNFIAKYPLAKHYSYELITDDLKKDAWEQVYGNRNLPVVDLDKAEVIVTFEADILGNEGNFVENIRKFTSNRSVKTPERFNRLYSIESKMSLTGMNADYRLRLKPIDQYNFIMALINEIVNAKSFCKTNLSPVIKAQISKFTLSDVVSKNNMNKVYVTNLIIDLIAKSGKGIVIAGNTHSLAVQTAVLVLNEILGNTALYNKEKSETTVSELSKQSELEILVGSMYAGNVGVVIHYDSNPIFDLPVFYGYSKAINKVKSVITLTELDSETSGISNYILPINHNFESWGDRKIRTGVYSLIQPLINPLYNTRQKESILLTWTTGDAGKYSSTIYHEFLKTEWQNTIYSQVKPLSDFSTFWYASLHDGVVEFKESLRPIVFGNVPDKAIVDINSRSNDGFTLILANNYSIGADGRNSNNGWLQELPNPITKITWDNYAMLSPATGKKLGVDFQSKILVKTPKGKSVTLPVVLQPGITDNTVVVELGYGRTKAGEIGSSVGVNVNVLINKEAFSPFIIEGCSVEKVSGKYPLASTQEHHMLDDKSIKDIHKQRHIIQEGTVDQYKKNPNFLKESKKELNLTMYPDHEYKDIKWAMAIDLNQCVGCSACVIACNVENNIPIVGKDQTMKGREMQWMRIDRYYSGTEEDPEVSNQPMLCQHCDAAPCENVCPVVATNHSPDGLNQMVYNRCVGTRYCSNNCPYKVRRYNYFDFRDHVADSYQKKDSLELMHNPEVTVRARGVMEKCTFCVQRIMDARQEATKAGKKVAGSDVVTACQQACPSNAITFGDMNDKKSEISELREHKLGYYVLEELNIKPNVTYIAKLRNKISEDK
jgi:molybdopterin-containing oxidoreductase family iron-sulfur binding subunit